MDEVLGRQVGHAVGDLGRRRVQRLLKQMTDDGVGVKARLCGGAGCSLT